MPTIIVPMNNTVKVDCIVQDGVKYCENTDLTSQEGGYALLLTAGILIWIFGWMYLMIEHDVHPAIVTFFALIFPLLLGALILLS